MAHTIRLYSQRVVFTACLVAVLFGCEALQNLEEPSPPSGPQPEIVSVSKPKAVAEKDRPSDFAKKRVLLLRWTNRSEYDAPAALALLQKRLADKIAGISDVQTVTDSEVDGSSAFYSLSGTDYNLPVAYRQTKTQGIAGFITGTLEAIRFEEEGEGGGLFSLKRVRTFATIRLDLHDSMLGRVVYSRTSTESIDEERAEILAERSAEGEKEQIELAAQKALAAVLPDLATSLERIAWSGRIAKIEWNRYYITGGLATGLKAGQLLRVFGETEPVEDPLTGKMLGLPPGRFKGLLKVVELFGTDAAVAIMHSGAGFRESDRIDVEPVSDAQKARP